VNKGMRDFLTLTGALLSITAPLHVVSASLLGSRHVQQFSHPLIVRAALWQDDRRVTLTVQDSSIGFVVRELARQARLQISYNDGNPQFKKRVHVTIANQPVMKALSAVLEGTGLVATMFRNEDMVVIQSQTKEGKRSQDDSGTISGRVVDSASGRAVRRATVHLDRSETSIVTSDSGYFALRDLPAGRHVLTIKALGYRAITRVVVLKGNTSVSIYVTLSPLATVLSGVVTTATGVQARRNVANDITSINVDSVMQTAPIHNVTDLLDGRVPGMTVVRTTGTPGDPARIRIRGAGSVEGTNAPIILIDNVRVYYTDDNTNHTSGNGVSIRNANTSYPRPSALDQLDPNMIERIDILKGPSAAALYGSESANGVISIITKRGKAGPTRVSLDATVGTSWIPGTYPLFGYGFGHFLTGGGSPNLSCVLDSYLSSACALDSVVSYQALNDPQYSPFVHGTNSGLSAAASGGASNLGYSFTGTAQNQHGVVRLPAAVALAYHNVTGQRPPGWMINPDGNQSMSGTGSLTSQISPTITVGIHTMLSTSEQTRSALSLGGVSQVIGRFVDTTKLAFTPLMTNFNERATADTKTWLNSADGTWTPRSWVTVTASAGINQDHNEDKRVTPAGIPSILLNDPFDSAGAYGVTRSDNSALSANVGTMFLVPLPGNRSIRLSTGFTGNNNSSTISNIQTRGFPIGVMDPSSFLPSETNVSQSGSSSATYGWYIEPAFNLGEHFIISPGIRLDGGSNSGTNATVSKFPKTSIVWIPLDDDFDSHFLGRLINTLKLRATYGYAGVLPLPGDQGRLMGEGTTVIDGTNPVTSVYPTTVGNTHLRPERSVELETGIDADLLERRLTMTVTYYHKKRLDAILEIPLAPSVGGGGGTGVLVTQSGGIAHLGTFKENIGTILNTGLELSAHVVVVQNSQLQWDLDLSTSQTANTLRSFYGQENSPGGPNSRLVVGYPIDGIWVHSLAGYADLNGDGVIEANEAIVGDSASYAGTQNPTHTNAVSSTFSFLNGRLSVNTLFSYNGGMTQYNALGLTSLASVATQPNATLAQQAIYAASTKLANGFPSETPWSLYQRVTIWRWNSASFNYTLPVSIAQLLRSHGASIALQGSNLWLHTNYRGKDPNVNIYSSGEGVADFGQIPEPRLWSLSVRLSN